MRLGEEEERGRMIEKRCLDKVQPIKFTLHNSHAPQHTHTHMVAARPGPGVCVREKEKAGLPCFLLVYPTMPPIHFSSKT